RSATPCRAGSSRRASRRCAWLFASATDNARGADARDRGGGGAAGRIGFVGFVLLPRSVRPDRGRLQAEERGAVRAPEPKVDQVVPPHVLPVLLRTKLVR